MVFTQNWGLTLPCTLTPSAATLGSSLDGHFLQGYDSFWPYSNPPVRCFYSTPPRRFTQNLGLSHYAGASLFNCAIHLLHRLCKNTWSSTRCTNKFTTSGYLSKSVSSESWYVINIQANSVTHTPGSSIRIQFRPVTASGAAMGALVTTTGGFLPTRYENITNVTTSRVHVEVFNPESGTNMASTGYFSGFYQ